MKINPLINHDQEVIMRKLGKKYVEASKKVERNNLYSKEEAIKLVK